MAEVARSKKVIKGSALLYLKTPLLIKSGYGDIFSDSTIEKTFDGENIHINGYVWASLMRRSLSRMTKGDSLAGKIGKYTKDREGVSPLWCEPSFVPVNGLYIRSGNAIGRKYGAAKAGALFNDEVAPAGLRMKLNWNYFLTDGENEEETKELIKGALWVINSGIENIGGGWSYGMGRLGVERLHIKTLDLNDSKDISYLWRFDKESLKDGEHLEAKDLKMPDIEKGWTVIKAQASIAKGQLLAIHMSYPLFEKSYFEYPDSFVYRGYIIDKDGKPKTECIIPGRTIRQALLSVPIERKIRTIGKDTICDSLAGACTCDTCREYRGKNKEGVSPDCECLKCNWFGSGGKGGIVAVADAVVEDGDSEVIHRIHLCEHSMQNINLFSGEYLTKGRFRVQVIIDESRNKEQAERLKSEIKWVLNQMKSNGASPPGWYRIGATSTATGQVEIINGPDITPCGSLDG